MEEKKIQKTWSKKEKKPTFALQWRSALFPWNGILEVQKAVRVKVISYIAAPTEKVKPIHVGDLDGNTVLQYLMVSVLFRPLCIVLRNCQP